MTLELILLKTKAAVTATGPWAVFGLLCAIGFIGQTDPSFIPPFFREHMSATTIALIGAILWLSKETRELLKLVKPMVNAVTVRVDEHDMLWEDFNIRTGEPWRRTSHQGRR
jgi:hypothetical protein